MAAKAAGQLFSGLLVGAAVGASVALVLAARADVTVPKKAGQHISGPTPFRPANEMLARARHLVDEVRTQVRFAIDEGKRTAADTRQDLNTRFEAAKQGKQL